MRHFILPLAILLCPAAPALAQVTVDLHALDALPRAPETATRHPAPSPQFAPRPSVAATPPSAPAQRPAAATAAPNAMPPPAAGALTGAPPPVTAPATPAPPRTVATVQPTAPPPSAAAPSAMSQPPPPAPTLPMAPPPVASIAPIQPAVPPPNAPAPPPPPIAAGAATSAAAMPAGVRLTFANGQSDLSPGSADSIKHLVQAAPAGDATTFNVMAYATGDPSDPSAARRLSLARAIAVRSVLMTSGVPSSRIYLRALGAPPGEQPPDRVDVSVLGANASQQ